MASIDDIQSRKLTLMDKDQSAEDAHPHRPDISIWADDDLESAPTVAVSIKALFGQPLRHLEMSPDEARTLAVLLKQVADDIDSVTEANNEAAYERQQERLMETGGYPTLRDQAIEAMKFK